MESVNRLGSLLGRRDLIYCAQLYSGIFHRLECRKKSNLTCSVNGRKIGKEENRAINIHRLSVNMQCTQSCFASTAEGCLNWVIRSSQDSSFDGLNQSPEEYPSRQSSGVYLISVERESVNTAFLHPTVHRRTVTVPVIFIWAENGLLIEYICESGISLSRRREVVVESRR